MALTSMSSKERILAAINFQETDYIPCSFMIFTALRSQCRDEYDFVERQLELGLDAMVNLPEFTLRFHPEVAIREWKEFPPGGRYPLLHREYQTPAGKLTAVVRQTEDWPYGDHVPLFDDYIAARSEKFLVTEESDLEKFQSLLLPPSDEEIRNFREESKRKKKFAADKGVAIWGGRTIWSERNHDELYGTDYGIMGIDALMWISGGVNPLYWAYDKPDFLEELIDMINVWNRKRMEIYLDEGLDIIIKRAWYESTEFWSPDLYEKYIVPVLREDSSLIHEAGVKLGYIMTGGIMPLLDTLLGLGVDINIGVDPLQGKGTNLSVLKEKCDRKMCLWGGVNGFLTIENGNEHEIRQAVENAISTLSKNSGFVLSPVDNVTEDTELTWQNVRHFMNAWKELRGGI